MLRFSSCREHSPTEVLKYERHGADLLRRRDFREAALELFGEDQALLAGHLAQVDHVIFVAGQVDGGIAVVQQTGDAFDVGEGSSVSDGVDQEETVGPMQGFL